MTEKRRVFVNALMSSVQVVVTAVTYLFLYRYLLESIGDQLAGVWALVLSWTTVMSAADLGLSGGSVKFVSKYRARSDARRVVQVVETSVLTAAAILLAVLPAVYPLMAHLLPLVVEPVVHVGDALAVLPYAFVSFWLTSVGGIVQSCIDGTQRVYVRNFLVMASSLLYLGLALFFVPRAGLIGLAQAQVLQAAVVVAGAWLSLRFLIPGLPVIPFRWSRPVFKEMLGYSVNFQAVSIARMLFQPVTKSLISKFGGLGAVFYFEMAHKLVFQLRALVVMAHQSLVPTIAHWHETSKERVQALYRSSFRILVFLVAAGLPLFVGLTPVISKLWIGAYNATFVAFAVLLSVSWFLNILVNPAYFGYMGIGRMRWNVGAHVVIAVINVGLGIFLGMRYGGMGVVVAYSVAVLVGSTVPLIAYHIEYDIRWQDLVDRHSAFLVTAGLAGMAMILLIQNAIGGRISPWLIVVILPLAYALVVGLPAWNHPVRTALEALIRDVAFNRRDSSTPSVSP